MLIKCEKCEHTFFTQDQEAWKGEELIKENDEEEKFAKCPKCGTLTEMQEDSYVRPKEQLPPFSTSYGPYGLEVYVGQEATGGGRWAMRGRDEEEEFRKMLQEAVDTWQKLWDVPECGDYPEGAISGFDRAVQFLLSHSVNMGWHVYVPQEMMDKLDEVDERRRSGPGKHTFKPDDGEHYVERVERVICPECSGDQIVLIEKSRTSGKRDFHIADGKIHPGEIYGEELDSDPTNEFRCKACGHWWDVPEWVDRQIEW